MPTDPEPGPPVISLLSDFGLQDPFVGIMKGVMLRICPTAQFVDLTHAVAPQDVAGGAFLLSESWRWFPRGTVHLAVVDPGVGSHRGALAVRIDGHTFVLPDNGLITDVWSSDCQVEAMVKITERRFALPEVSRTFHGRDVFAPAAAHLAAGLPITALGPELEHPRLLPSDHPKPDGDGLRGVVRHIDRFGNLITNIRDVAVDIWQAPDLDVQIGTHHVRGHVRCYADVAPGEIAIVINSFGLLEIAVNGGSAADRLRVTVGTPVRVFPG